MSKKHDMQQMNPELRAALDTIERALEPAKPALRLVVGVDFVDGRVTVLANDKGVDLTVLRLDNPDPDFSDRPDFDVAARELHELHTEHDL